MIIGRILAFLWGLFVAALKFAFVVLGILAKFLIVIIAIALLILFLIKRRST